MENLTRVEGLNKGNVVLYALSTCVWCKKARKLLDDLGVEYYYIYVDMLDTEKNVRAREEIKKWNPQCSFPTIIINNEKCIAGFDEERIKKEIGE